MPSCHDEFHGLWHCFTIQLRGEQIPGWDIINITVKENGFKIL